MDNFNLLPHKKRHLKKSTWLISTIIISIALLHILFYSIMTFRIQRIDVQIKRMNQPSTRYASIKSRKPESEKKQFLLQQWLQKRDLLLTRILSLEKQLPDKLCLTAIEFHHQAMTIHGNSMSLLTLTDALLQTNHVPFFNQIHIDQLQQPIEKNVVQFQLTYY